MLCYVMSSLCYAYYTLCYIMLRVQCESTLRPDYGSLKQKQLFFMRAGVEEELKRLVKEGTLESIKHSDRAAPIFPVFKSDQKTVRVCGDFRLRVNPVSKLDQYPIPKVEELFAMLDKGDTFTKLDLSQAYQQLAGYLENYVLISTHKGLFRYMRLP